MNAALTTLANIEQFNTLGVALIVAVVGPVVLSWIAGRQRRIEAKLGYARQDALVAQAKANAEAQNVNNDKQNKKLDEIHILVNSNMTKAIENELDARRAQLASQEEVASLRVPTEELLYSIEETKARIIELRAILADRRKHH